MFSEDLAAELESSGPQLHLFLGWSREYVGNPPETFFVLFLSKFELFGLIFPVTMMINAVMQPLPLRSHEWIRDAAVLEWKRTCCFFTAKESSIGLRHPGPLGREVLQIRCITFATYSHVAHDVSQGLEDSGLLMR